MLRNLTRRVPRRVHLSLLAAAIVGTTIVALPVFALSPGTFEGSDGNLVANGGKDWNDNGINRQIKADKPTGSGDDSFGNGTKEDTAVPVVTDGSIPNNKSDLTNFYVGSESVESPAGTFNDFLYLGWSRVQDPSGTTNLDFELNQSNTLSSNGVTYVRTPDDVLIKYDLSNGGTNPTLGIQKWKTTGADSQCEAGKIPCWNKSVPLTAGVAEAGLNSTSVLDPFASPPKMFDPRTFGEAAINLQGAGIFTPGACVNFGHAYVKSRSSDSFTAAVKDFIAPVSIGLNSCPPATVKLKKVASGTNGALLGGASFELYRDTDNSGTINAGDQKITPTATPPDPCVTVVADGIGNCIFSVSVAGQYLAQETAAPPGYTADPTVQVFTVTISRNTSVITRTFTDSPQPGTIRVTKDDGAGTKLAGATFELYAGSTATGTVLQTQTTTASPLGVVEFTGLEPGTYTVKETAAPPGYDLPATTTQTTTIAIAAGGDLKFLTFSDTPTKGSIKVDKKDVDTALPLDGATFQLWQDLGVVGTLEPSVDAPLGTCTSLMGTCTFGNLAPGKYIVEETAAPSGYDLPSPTYQAVTITIKNGGDNATLTFNDKVTPGQIDVTKYDDDDPQLKLGGAQFALFLDNGDGISNAGDTSKGTCTTSSANDSTLGTCSFTGLAPGVYFVVETAAPSGYDLPTDPTDRIKKVTIVKTSGGDTKGVNFSDPRRFTVITVVCQEKGKKLYPSSVIFDGVTKLSAAAGDLAAGTTEAEVCDLTKARFEGRHFGGPTAGSVTIPK